MTSTQNGFNPSRKGRSKQRLTLKEQIIHRLNRELSNRQKLPKGFDPAMATLIVELDGLTAFEVDRIFPDAYAYWDGSKASIVFENEENADPVKSLPSPTYVISVHINERNVL